MLQRDIGAPVWLPVWLWGEEGGCEEVGGRLGVES